MSSQLLSNKQVAAIFELSQLLTKKQVAALLGVSERTITRWDREGRFSRVQLTERTVRYRQEEIHRMVEDANPNTSLTGQKISGRGRSNA